MVCSPATSAGYTESLAALHFASLWLVLLELLQISRNRILQPKLYTSSPWTLVRENNITVHLAPTSFNDSHVTELSAMWRGFTRGHLRALLQVRHANSVPALSSRRMAGVAVQSSGSQTKSSGWWCFISKFQSFRMFLDDLFFLTKQSDPFDISSYLCAFVPQRQNVHIATAPKKGGLFGRGFGWGHLWFDFTVGWAASSVGIWAVCSIFPQIIAKLFVYLELQTIIYPKRLMN